MQEATESSRMMRGAAENSYEYIPEQQPEYIEIRINNNIIILLISVVFILVGADVFAHVIAQSIE